MSRLVRLAIALIVAATLVPVASPRPALGADRTARTTLSPLNTIVGSPIAVGGNGGAGGWNAGEAVTIWLADSNGEKDWTIPIDPGSIMGTAVADVNGNWGASFILPDRRTGLLEIYVQGSTNYALFTARGATPPAGTYSNTTTPGGMPPGAEYGPGIRRTLFPNSISGLGATRADTPVNTINVFPYIDRSPSSGPPGTVITINGTGFGRLENGITLNFTGAGGIVNQMVASGITANSSGAWTATFAVPDGPPGTYNLDVNTGSVLVVTGDGVEGVTAGLAAPSVGAAATRTGRVVKTQTLPALRAFTITSSTTPTPQPPPPPPTPTPTLAATLPPTLAPTPTPTPTAATPAPIPTVAWSKQFGTSSRDYATGTAVDGAGNAYVAGYTAGALPGQASSGNFDAFLRKYDGTGALLWTRQFGSSGYEEARGIALDAAGNAYVAGFTAGALGSQSSAGGWDAFLVKYESSGNPAWVRQFGSPGNDSAYAIALDSSGNIYLAGHTDGALSGQTSAGGYDGFLVKYDSNGNLLWARQFGSSSTDYAYGAAVNASGNIWVTGYTWGAMYGQTSAGDWDAYVTKFNASGDRVWTRQTGSTVGDYGYSVAADSAGNAYVVGATEGMLPGQTGSYPSAFIIRYTDSGATGFIRQFGGTPAGPDSARSVVLDSSENLEVVGYLQGAFPGLASSGGYDAFVRKYDKDGNVIHSAQSGSSASDFAHAVALDASGNIFIAGYTTGALSGQSSSGVEDAFLVKFNPADTSSLVPWPVQFGSSGSDQARGVASDGAGNAYVAGYTSGTLPGQVSSGYVDAFLSRYGSDGAALWTRQFGSTPTGYDYAYAVAAAGPNEIYVAGATTEALPGEGPVGADDAFLRKYDGAGETIWTRQFGSTEADSALALAADGQGNVYVAGRTSGVLPGQSPQGSNDAFIRKYDRNGYIAWTRQFGTTENDWAAGVAVDRWGNTYVVGNTGGVFPGQPSGGGIPPPTLTPSPTPTPTASPSPTPGPAPSPTQTPTPAPGASPSPSPWPSATPSPSASPSPVPSPSPSPTPTPAPTPGNAWAWGSGTSVPSHVGGTAGITTIAAGEWGGMALRSDGTVWTWGSVGSTAVQVSGLTGVAGIAAGGYHSLAMKSDGTVWAWGDNSYGQLGNGVFGGSAAAPVQVTGLTGVAAVAAGRYHSLALKPDGTVWTWGDNESGQLGTGTSGLYSSSAVPVQVSGLGGAMAIAAGWYHSLAVKSDGTPWAWGEGIGPTPARVSGLSGVMAVAAGGHPGEYHSLALKSDGAVWAWGDNRYGQLGDGTTSYQSSVIRVTGLDGVRAIAAGGYHSLALKSDDTVWAWGSNNSSQLGNSIMLGSATPVRVSGLSGVAAIAAGLYHSLALIPGSLSPTPSPSPTPVAPTPTPTRSPSPPPSPSPSPVPTPSAIPTPTPAPSAAPTPTRTPTPSATSTPTPTRTPTPTPVAKPGSVMNAEAKPREMAAGGQDGFIRKYDSNGNEIWTRQFGTTGNDSVWGVATDSSGNVYVVGDTTGVLPGQTASGSGDIFLIKYNPAGSVVWTRQFGSSGADSGKAVAVDISDNVYVAGTLGIVLSNYYEAFVRKYSSAGGEMWTTEFGSTAPSASDSALALAPDGSSGIYIAGYAGSNLPGRVSLGGVDAFLHKLSSTGAVATNAPPPGSGIPEMPGVVAGLLVPVVCLAAYLSWRRRTSRQPPMCQIRPDCPLATQK